MKDAQSSDMSSEAAVSVGTSWLGNWLDSRTGYRAIVKSAQNGGAIRKLWQAQAEAL